MRPQRNTAAEQPGTLVGQVLAGRYRLLELLGAGGMASVYLAEHVTLGKRIAIKILNDDLCRDRAQVDRFLQEARAASMIGHGNIVDIIDFGRGANGSVFYAMEHLEGENLAALLQRERRIPWARARELMIQIARALSAAHDKGVIHRDLKPANCFLVRRSDGRPFVKVLDFGIARVTDPGEGDGRVLTLPGAVFGTAKYMAPEQACGAPADARTDIYAAAVCLYELLTGSVPYDGDSFLRVLNRHITEPLTPPTTRAPEAGISLFVEAVIVKALEKRPDDRYQTMAELEAAMSAIGLDGNLVETPNPGPPWVGAGLARPSGSGPTGTIWLGPPKRSAPTRTPTIRLETPLSEGDDGVTCMIAPVAPMGPPLSRPVVRLAAAPLPTFQSPPTMFHHDASTRTSPLKVAVALVAGAIMAIAAGAFAAWLLIGGWPDDGEAVARPTVVQVDPKPVTQTPEPVVALPIPARPSEPVEPVEPVAPPSIDSVPQDPPPAAEPALADAPEPERKRPATERRQRDVHRERTAVNVARGFSRAHARARACMGDSSPSRIMVRATLSASGKVLDVDVVDARDPALAECIRKAVASKARFAKAAEPLEIRSWTFAS